LCEVVLEALGPFAVADTVENSSVDEAVQAIRKHVPRNPEVLEQPVKAVAPERDVADHQERPAVAHHLEGACNRADLAFVIALQHEAKDSRGRLRDASYLAYSRL